MAKLLIFRGETLLDQRELTGKTLKIGRSAQSDIVLEDPGKGVSRNHAELRFEDGRYTLVDLQSQNGIWVAGSRVPSAVLDPSVVATVGPFRLMVEAPAAAVAAAGPDTAPIEPTQFLDRSVDPIALLAKEPVPAKAEAPVPPADERPRAKAIVEPPRPKPVDERPRLKTADERPSAKTLPPSPPPAESDQWYAQPRILVGALAAALLVAASAFAAYKLVHKSSPAVWDSAIAQALIASGRCQEAMDKEITPALQANPNNQEAQSLRDKCANPPPPPAHTEPTSTVPPAPTADEKLTEAETLVASNECQKAQETVNAVLAQEPDNTRAKDLLAKVNACLTPTPVPPTPGPEKPQIAKALPPEKGGLTPLPNETQKDYAARVAAKHQQYTEALALIDNQRYLQARRALDEIAQDVPAGYLDLAQRREELGNTIKAEAKKRFETAQGLDAKNEFDGATEAYRRAHDLDASIQIDAPIQRLNDRKLELGRKRCQQGRLDYLYGQTATAIPELQDAVKYLPPTEECAVKAREILQKLGK